MRLIVGLRVMQGLHMEGQYSPAYVGPKETKKQALERRKEHNLILKFSEQNSEITKIPLPKLQNDTKIYN